MADPGTEIVKVETVTALPAPTKDVVVIARSPEEMASSQAGLLIWAEQKLAAEQAQLREKEVNLSHAKQGKYQTTRWQRQVTLAKSRVLYYEKVLQALQAGYYIVPAIPGMDTVVIRTKRVRPQPNERESQWGRPNVPDQKGQILPIGEGRYVSPTPTVDRWDETREKEGGKKETFHLASAVDYAEIDFPFHIVRPQILQDFNHALELRIFDEISVLPARRRKGDPMVIGTVKRREGYNEHTINFLISWWVDTRDL